MMRVISILCSLYLSWIFVLSAQEKPYVPPGLKPIQETTAQIMARSSSEPLFADVLNESMPLITTTRSPQTVSSINFTAVTLADCNAFPPDSDGVVGPSQFMTVVNGRIRTFSKATGAADGVLNVSLDTFFESVRNNQFTSDPKVRFDRFSDHWFIVCINEGSGPNRVLLAVSNSRVITADTIWRIFYFVQDTVSPAGDTGYFFDYPTLGIDTYALYIGGNMFDSNNNYVDSTCFVIQKSSMFSLDGPLVATAFRNVSIFTPQGVDIYDTGATQGYFVGTISNSGLLGLRIISNPGSSSPSISSVIDISVPAFSEPPSSVPALGSTISIESLDSRLAMAHIRNKQLWTVHNIGVNSSGGSSSIDREGSRWYQIDMTTPTSPSLVQSGTLYDSTATNPLFYWMPSVMSSGQGNLALGCSVAGASAYLNAATVGRLSTDATGTLETPVVYTASSTAYNPPGDPDNPYRWGDYSITSCDPQDNMTMWTIQEFCNATNSYGCQVAQLIAPPPATVTSANPASVAHGQSSVSVTITGASASGSAFYDPGSGYEKRLTCQMSGGIVVKEVTAVTATSVSVTIDTSYASQGLQSVRIQNPDGQQSVGAVLTIT